MKDAYKVNYLSETGIEVRNIQQCSDNPIMLILDKKVKNLKYKAERLKYWILLPITMLAYIISYVIPLAIIFGLMYLVFVVAKLDNILMGLLIGYTGANLLVLNHFVASLLFERLEYPSKYNYE